VRLKQCLARESKNRRLVEKLNEVNAKIGRLDFMRCERMRKVVVQTKLFLQERVDYEKSFSISRDKAIEDLMMVTRKLKGVEAKNRHLTRALDLTRKRIGKAKRHTTRSSGLLGKR
jgi:hypothetical protein